MELERWREAERLCLLALERAESERAAFLKEACGGRWLRRGMRRASWKCRRWKSLRTSWRGNAGHEKH